MDVLHAKLGRMKRMGMPNHNGKSSGCANAPVDVARRAAPGCHLGAISDSILFWILPFLVTVFSFLPFIAYLPLPPI